VEERLHYTVEHIEFSVVIYDAEFDDNYKEVANFNAWKQLYKIVL